MFTFMKLYQIKKNFSNIILYFRQDCRRSLIQHMKYCHSMKVSDVLFRFPFFGLICDNIIPKKKRKETNQERNFRIYVFVDLLEIGEKNPK